MVSLAEECWEHCVFKRSWCWFYGAPTRTGQTWILFGAATEDQTEAAGLELSASFTSRKLISKDVYLLIDLSAGLSHIPGAPIVMGSESPTMLFTAATVGMGF